MHMNLWKVVVGYIYTSQSAHDVFHFLSRGGKMVDPTPEIERELKTELERVAKQYGGGEGTDMTKFPEFKFEEPKVDPINLQSK